MGCLALGENSRSQAGKPACCSGQRVLGMQYTRLVGLPLTSHFA